MKCKKCKASLDRNTTRCPICGTLTPAGLQQQKRLDESEKGLTKSERDLYKLTSVEYWIKKTRIMLYVCFGLYVYFMSFFLFSFFYIYKNGGNFAGKMTDFFMSLLTSGNKTPYILISIGILLLGILAYGSWFFVIYWEFRIHSKGLENAEKRADEAREEADRNTQSGQAYISFDSSGNANFHSGASRQAFTFAGVWNIIVRILLFLTTPIIFPFDSIRWLIKHRYD